MGPWKSSSHKFNTWDVIYVNSVSYRTANITFASEPEGCGLRDFKKSGLHSNTGLRYWYSCHLLDELLNAMFPHHCKIPCHYFEGVELSSPSFLINIYFPPNLPGGKIVHSLTYWVFKSYLKDYSAAKLKNVISYSVL